MAARLNVHDALARLSVVVPVGPGDRLSPVLRLQLAALPAAAEVHLVCADAAAMATVAGAAGAYVADASQQGPAWSCSVAAAGRSAQQNAGARAGANPWLWFLHADSQLTPRSLPALAAWLRDDRPALGYFDLRFFGGPPLMALNTLGAWLRSRVLGLPFGDQGLVLPRRVFEALGGFDETLKRGEDHDLVWRARRAGVPLRPLRAALRTSARRYAEYGWARTTARTVGESWRQARRFAREAPAEPGDAGR